MNHVMVVDLGYGDAGKGTVVDLLCATRQVHTVVRFNGGAQAAHNVVLRDGRHHTFAQFGAGTFRPGVRTHLARHVVVDPLALAAEADHLASVGVPDALDRLTVDGEALLAFSHVTNLRTIPTTLVLDREGRVAALINGAIPGKVTLTDVVEEIAAEET